MFELETFRRSSAVLALCAGLLAAGGAVAEAAVAADTPSRQAESRVQVDEAKVCKRVVPTGSRIARRYCLTKSQWDAMREEGQKAARDAFALESQYGYDANPSGS